MSWSFNSALLSLIFDSYYHRDHLNSCLGLERLASNNNYFSYTIKRLYKHSQKRNSVNNKNLQRQ